MGLRPDRHQPRHQHRQRQACHRNCCQEGRQQQHHRQHPGQRQQRHQQLAEQLLQALRDVVDVVGDAAERLAMRLPVEPVERQPGQLFFGEPAQPPAHLLHQAGDQPRLPPVQRGGAGVEPGHERELPAHGRGVNPASLGHAPHDQVGRQAELPWPQCAEEDAGGGQRHGKCPPPALLAKKASGAAKRGPCIARLGPGAYAGGGAGRSHERAARRRDALGFFHSTSSCPDCEATISA